MAAQNPSLSLQPHQLKIVDIFRYEYGNASLDEKLIQYAPEESVSSRFLIKMEIARLAKTCNRIIDLRDSQADWKPFEYNGIKHYIPNSSPKCDTLQFKRLASFLQKPWLAA